MLDARTVFAAILYVIVCICIVCIVCAGSMIEMVSDQAVAVVVEKEGFN